MGVQGGVRPWIHPNDGVGDDEMNEQRTLSRNKGGIVFVVLLHHDLCKLYPHASKTILTTTFKHNLNASVNPPSQHILSYTLSIHFFNPPPPHTHTSHPPYHPPPSQPPSFFPIFNSPSLRWNASTYRSETSGGNIVTNTVTYRPSERPRWWW